MNELVAVLVVEDEPLILIDIAFQLEAEGFKVYEATTADEAIDLLSIHTDIHVIFTDIDMPGSMDGLKLAAAVRDRWPPVRIIVTSGRQVVGEAMMPSGSIFVKKPYDHQSIARTIRELTGR